MDTRALGAPRRRHESGIVGGPMYSPDEAAPSCSDAGMPDLLREQAAGGSEGISTTLPSTSIFQP
jgi:hypothetical protein